MTMLTWTYNTLSQALQVWLDDTDQDWTSTFTGVLQGVSFGTGILPLNYLIQLGEQRIVDDLDLTIFDQAVTVNLPQGTGTNNVVARPAGIIVTDEIGYQTPSGPSAGKFNVVERRDYSWVLDYLDPAVTGAPVYYAEQDATNWIFAPYANQTYTLLTWGPYAHASLLDVAVTATTWLSANAAQVLFEACQFEAAKLLKNMGLMQATFTEYQKKLGSLKVRFRALRRDTLESPRQTSLIMPEGSTPGAREQ